MPGILYNEFSPVSRSALMIWHSFQHLQALFIRPVKASLKWRTFSQSLLCETAALSISNVFEHSIKNMLFKRICRLHRACWTMMRESICILYLLSLFHNLVGIFHRLNISHFEGRINMVVETYRIFIIVGHCITIEGEKGTFTASIIGLFH